MNIEEKGRLGIADLLLPKREEIIRIAEKHGASNVRVFGSVARGEATDESDIDLLVDWDSKRLSSWGGIGLYFELEELLGRKVDICSPKELHKLIRENVLKELKDKHPQVPWQKVAGFRNFLIHVYWALDTECVWEIIETDLPPLKTQIEEILRELDKNESKQEYSE